MKTLELAITVVYFAVCIGLAARFRRRAAGASADYWMAGQGVPFWINTGSAFAVPLPAGIWSSRANALGGLLAAAGGFSSYVGALLFSPLPPFSQILVALPVSLLGMFLGVVTGAPPEAGQRELVARLHARNGP